MQVDTSVQTHLQSARAALQKRHHWVAVPALRSVVQAEPNHVEAYELLGIAETFANNPTAARHAFIQATRKDPARISAHFNFALFLFNQNDLDEAAEELTTTLYLSPNHTGAIALEKQLKEKLKFRDHTAEEGFSLIGSQAPDSGKLSVLRGLECPTCGHKNVATVKVCKKCNCLIPEMPDIIPLE